jgi:hypothetical protein
LTCAVFLFASFLISQGLNISVARAADGRDATLVYDENGSKAEAEVLSVRPLAVTPHPLALAPASKR